MTKRKGKSKPKPKKRKPISARRRKQINLLISKKASLRAIDKKLQVIESGRVKGDPKEIKRQYNELLNEGVGYNTLIHETQQKLNKHNVKKKRDPFRDIKEDPDKDDVTILGKVWEKQDVEDFIFISGQINSVNKLNVDAKQSEILDLLNRMYRVMGSDDYIKILSDANGDSDIQIVNGKDIDDESFLGNEEI